MLHAVNAIVFAGQGASVDKTLPERLVENFVDEGALAGAGSAGDRDQFAQRDRHVYVLQVVLARPANVQRLACSFAPLLRRANETPAGKELPGGGRFASQHIAQAPLHHDSPAMDAGSGAHLHDMIGGADGILVVLHHDDGVADVAQAFERGDHLHVVFRDAGRCSVHPERRAFPSVRSRFAWTSGCAAIRRPKACRIGD